jgi:hypothetical protein
VAGWPAHICKLKILALAKQGYSEPLCAGIGEAILHIQPARMPGYRRFFVACPRRHRIEFVVMTMIVRHGAKFMARQAPDKPNYLGPLGSGRE